MTYLSLHSRILFNMSPERRSFAGSLIAKVRSVEQNPKLYERIGIRVFKKYAIPYGDLANKHFWNKLGMYNANLRDGQLKSLERMRFATYSFEAMHLITGGYVTKQIIDTISNGGLDSVAELTLANVIVNIYPILLQHYTRGRLSRAIKRQQVNASLTDR